MYGCVGLCRAMLGYVWLCKAIERNVFHILADGEPLYDAYTTYLPLAINLSSLVGVRLDVIQSSDVKAHYGFPGNRLPSMTKL